MTDMPLKDLSEVTAEYRNAQGRLRRRQLFKQVIRNRTGPWALVILVWQDWREKGKVANVGWQPPRFAIERWRKAGERWRQETRLSLSMDHAQTVLGVIVGLDLDELKAAATDELPAYFEQKSTPA